MDENSLFRDTTGEHIVSINFDSALRPQLDINRLRKVFAWIHSSDPFDNGPNVIIQKCGCSTIVCVGGCRVDVDLIAKPKEARRNEFVPAFRKHIDKTGWDRCDRFNGEESSRG
jgi:hypothetical protein